MNRRRDEQFGRQQFGRHNEQFEDERDRDAGERATMGGRGQDDWRSDSERSGWGTYGGDGERFGGGLRGGQGGGRFSGVDTRAERGGFESQGRFGPGVRGGRESHGYEGGGPRGGRESHGYEAVGPRGGYGYGEGMFGGFSYAEEGMRGAERGGTGASATSGRRWPNEGLSNDFSLEGTRNFARDERRESHRGKGPKGFTRSDDRIREDVCQILADHHDIDATDIEVAVKGGEVTLSGTVSDRRTKRLAEHVIEEVSGVLDIHNTIRVAKAEATAQPSAPAANGRANGNQTTQSPRH